MTYQCAGEARKSAILGNSAITLNGIDYLELQDQQTLLVHCLQAIPSPLSWTTDNVAIEGGDSITGITAVSVASSTAAANVLVVQTNQPGDFSTYRLRLVNSAARTAQNPFDVTDVLADFYPQLAEVEFSFKIECGPNFDCGAQPADCLPASPTPPPINYLAKDYGS